MDTRLTIVFVDGHQYKVEEINMPQNVDAILVIVGNRVMLWQRVVENIQVSYSSEVIKTPTVTIPRYYESAHVSIFEDRPLSGHVT